ncbi:MAG: non-ribosomal peptide synthetase [Halanaerobiales bacterium]|nr:non-ribosomal peptide synthetase [Halanaerobiales bacterium]
MHYLTIVEVFQSKKGVVDKGITLISGENDEKFVSYDEIYTNALIALANLKGKGVKPGDKVIFQIENNESFIYFFWGCIIGGIVPVPINNGNTDELKIKFVKIWSTLDNPFLVCSATQLSNLETYAKEKEFLFNLSEKSLTLEEVQSLEPVESVYNACPEDIAFIQFSSGSTGNPKGVVLTHKNIITNIDAMITDSKIQDDDITFSWMPLIHDMGIIGFHLTPVVKNLNHCLMSVSLFIKRPVLWLTKVQKHKATFLSSPNFGYKHFLHFFKPEKFPHLDLSSVRLIFNGAEPISTDICDQFLGQMAEYNLKTNSMFAVYGMAEAGLAVTFSPVSEEYVKVKLDRRSLGVGDRIKEYNHDIDQENKFNFVEFVDLGYPVKNCYVKICNDAGEELEEELIGNIFIKGDNVTSGYYNNQEATENLIKDGWLNTGDVGFLRNGRLVITGRAKDIIFVNGHNVYPHDIERVAQELPEVDALRDIAVCGVNIPGSGEDKICCFLRYKKGLTKFIKLEDKVKRYIRFKMGLEISYVIPISKIPKTTSGKVQRYKLKEMFEVGEFDSLVQELSIIAKEEMVKRVIEEPRNLVEQSLVYICKKIMKLDQVGINENFIELGGNSLLLTEVYNEVEKIYPGKVQISDLYTYPTIAKMVEYISKGEDITLATVSLSPSYFANNSTSENGYLQYSLDETATDQLKKLSLIEGVSWFDILLSLYIYLLTEVNQNKLITVQSSTGVRNQIKSLSVDLTLINDFSSVFTLTKETLDNSEAGITYSITELNRLKVSKEKYVVNPLFYNKYFIKAKVNLLNIYDFIIEVSEVAQAINIIFEYSSRLDKEKMRNFFAQYVKFIALLLDQVSYQEVAAVKRD